MTFLEIRDQANRVREIPLEAVLRLSGAKRDPYDKAKWHTAQGILSVTGSKFMNWTRGGGGGGAIDLAIHLNHLDFMAAVAWLGHHFPSAGPQGPAPTPPSPRGRPALILPPKDDRQLARVRRYLIHDRRLPAALIQSLLDAGTLHADPRGNAVFLLLGKENRPVGAEIRGTTPRPWRAMARGSRKDRGYFSIRDHHATTTVVLCESAIDAISCVAIHPRSLGISTSGARPNPRWLPELLGKRHPVYCGFDADPTGDNMARALIALHPIVKRMRPPRHDWNDVLRSPS